MNIFIKHGSATVNNPLKNIDGGSLKDRDFALLFNLAAGTVYPYLLDVDSGLAESLPNVVAPTYNPQDKRWIRLTLYT